MITTIDIGNAYFEIKDTSYTKNDKHVSPRADDCVRDSSENDPDNEGRVGCDMAIKQGNNILFQFKPEDLEISNLKILPMALFSLSKTTFSLLSPTNPEASQPTKFIG